jgi:uncharacterized protein YdaU (DUF1376 family)
MFCSTSGEIDQSRLTPELRAATDKGGCKPERQPLVADSRTRAHQQSLAQ